MKKTPTIRLPKDWHGHIRSAILHVISLAQYATVHTGSWAVDSLHGRLRLKAENDRLLQELALEREANRIRDARMTRIAALRRPHDQYDKLSSSRGTPGRFFNRQQPGKPLVKPTKNAIVVSVGDV